jgi:hypothetical protein
MQRVKCVSCRGGYSFYIDEKPQSLGFEKLSQIYANEITERLSKHYDNSLNNDALIKHFKYCTVKYKVRAGETFVSNSVADFPNEPQIVSLLLHKLRHL